MRAAAAATRGSLTLTLSRLLRPCPWLFAARPLLPTLVYGPLSFLFSLSSAPLSCSSPGETLSSGAGGSESSPTDAADVFRRWGCAESEVSEILSRRPVIGRMKPAILQAKLGVLHGLGIRGPDLVRIVACRPRFLSGRIGLGLDGRVDFLRRTFFPSDAALLRAVVRNPSLLTYDVDRTMRPCVALYEGLGVPLSDLAKLLVSRPTIIRRSSLDGDGEKLDLIRRTGLPRGAAMYKYAVSIVAVSRLETIRSKLANLEKFGFSADEVMGLFARTPNVLTLSVDKVQRNMTYLVGTMKLPARVVLEKPHLLYCNLDKVLRPRHLLLTKLQEMGLLQPQIKEAQLVTTMRMEEPRFLRKFLLCHGEDTAKTLMEYYTSVKEQRRLAESSRSGRSKGFPF